MSPTSRVLEPDARPDAPGAQIPPWEPDSLDADGRELSDRARSATPELRRRARAVLRLAFLHAAAARECEAGDQSWRWGCFRSSRDMERLLYEARREPRPEHTWQRHGRLVTIRTMRPVRIRSGIRWRLVDDVHLRFVGFGQEAEVWRDWLWARVKRNAPPAPAEQESGPSHREGYELVYGRARRDDT